MCNLKVQNQIVAFENVLFFCFTNFFFLELWMKNKELTIMLKVGLLTEIMPLGFNTKLQVLDSYEVKYILTFT